MQRCDSSFFDDLAEDENQPEDELNVFQDLHEDDDQYPVKRSSTYKEIHYPPIGPPVKVKTRVSLDDDATSENGYGNLRITRKVQSSVWDDDGDDYDESASTGGMYSAMPGSYPVRRSTTYKEVHHPRNRAPIKIKSRLSWDDDPMNGDNFANPKITGKVQTRINLDEDSDGSDLDDLLNLGSQAAAYGMNWYVGGMGRRNSPFAPKRRLPRKSKAASKGSWRSSRY